MNDYLFPSDGTRPRWSLGKYASPSPNVGMLTKQLKGRAVWLEPISQVTQPDNPTLSFLVLLEETLKHGRRSRQSVLLQQKARTLAQIAALHSYKPVHCGPKELMVLQQERQKFTQEFPQFLEEVSEFYSKKIGQRPIFCLILMDYWAFFSEQAQFIQAMESYLKDDLLALFVVDAVRPQVRMQKNEHLVFPLTSDEFGELYRSTIDLSPVERYHIQIRFAGMADWEDVSVNNSFWDTVRYIERTTYGEDELVGGLFDDDEPKSFITLLMEHRLRVWDRKEDKDVSSLIESKLWAPREPEEVVK